MRPPARSWCRATRQAGALPCPCSLPCATGARSSPPGGSSRRRGSTPGRAHPSTWAAPSVSPLLAAHGGLPPLLIQAGSDDLLAPDAELLAARASAAGVDVTYTRWPRMWHNFALQPGLLAAADSALSQAAWFVETVTGS